MSLWFDTLNDKQKEAVCYLNGPLFVVAGAGTGKTKTLTSRIAYLVEVQGVDPKSILAVTFTNKAAKEMKERLIDMVGPLAINVWIDTFHAFGLKVLRRDIEALDLGYDSNFNIADEEDAKGIVRDGIKALNLDSKVYKVNDIRHKISRYKHFKEDNFKDDLERNVYHYYKRNLVEAKLLDFDDLQVYTRDLLKKSDRVRRYYRDLFSYILVDEFQDTDDIQYDILTLLVKEKEVPELFVVGDPDQSIYSFRGANYQNAYKFQKDFGKEHVLDINYRSTNAILKYANNLIKKNGQRPFDKNLSSNLGDGAEPQIISADTDYQEAFLITDEINRLVNYEGYRYDDIAVLYRNNALSRIFEDTFIKNNIPYVIYGGMSFYERKEVKDMLAYIRLIMNPALDFYLKRVINVPKRAIGPTTVKKLEETAYHNHTSLLDAIEWVSISSKTKQSLDDFKALIERMRDYVFSLDDMTHIITYIARESGYMVDLEVQNDDISRDRIDNIKELASVFVQGDKFYEGTLIERLTQLLDQIALYTELDKHISHDVVKLSTYHQVKGLEFRVVFMVAMEEDIFPSGRSIFDPSDLEEERRICYVGITRAKDRLYLTRADRRMLYGTTQYLRPSRFLSEVRPKAVSEGSTFTMKQVQENRHVSSSLSSGDKVSHVIFGIGMVVSVTDDIATIAFSFPHGIKKILENHPALTKIKE